MSARLKALFEAIPSVGTLGDVGCDHGYCAQYALQKGLCERAYISDISRESLKKAETLLLPYIRSGRCVPLCCDGLEGYPELPDCVLVAGMGGEETVKILSFALPAKFVLQPMKNAEKVRAFLVERGCRITTDRTLCSDGKFYDLIAGERTGGSLYSELELLFGRENVRAPSADFLKKAEGEREKLKALLASGNLGRASEADVRARLQRWEELQRGTQRNL